jgi:Spy/CpxP family protein refolding chaperone
MVKGQAENKGEWKRCELWARRVHSGKETALWQIDGQSKVVSAVAINGKGVHNVKLRWEGYIESKSGHAQHFALSARGSEKLQFANNDNSLRNINAAEVAFLPAGRPIDVEGGVRYGIVGVAPAPASVEPPAAAQAPDEARKQLIEVLGGPFIVFRDRVHDELKLSDEQRQKLLDTFSDHVQETMKVFERIMDLKPQDREQQMQEHCRKSDGKLSAFLKDLLEAKQRERLFQLQVQHAGAFALLGRNEAFEKLKITDEQRKQLMTVVQEMHQAVASSTKDIPPGADPAKIMAKVQEIRRAHSARIEALLSRDQKKAWKEVLGAPFDLGD